jgi:iron-sulfur cluster assembly protein
MATPITLTTAASKRLAHIQKETGAAAVRISLKKGGCAGMEYTLEPILMIPTTATKVQQEDAVLVIDPLAEMFLLGTEIDHQETLLESGFVFRNPNVQSTCGCGASVGF